MIQTRVSAEELFTLADQIMKLSDRATRCSQSVVMGELESSLTKILEAAKSAAFNEAHEQYYRSKT